MIRKVILKRIKWNIFMKSLWLGTTSLGTFLLPFPWNVFCYLVSLFNTAILTANIIAYYLTKKKEVK